MAEKVKVEIGSAIPMEKVETMEIKGRDAIAGLPKAVVVSSSEITEAIQPYLLEMVNAIKGVLEATPPELSSDIVDKGMVLTGGTSMLRNLDRLFSVETGVPAHVAEEPLLCVVKGTGMALENLDTFKKNITARK